MNLQLSLKRKWFEMTAADIKTEDYREINPYWVKRLFKYDRNHLVFKSLKSTDVLDFIDLVSGYNKLILKETLNTVGCLYGMELKNFTTNTMTLGYPKKGDSSRIIQFEHAGIEIREGNPEWGAEPGKLYFVIKHGKRL